jgi:hypothetical protein
MASKLTVVGRNLTKLTSVPELVPQNRCHFDQALGRNNYSDGSLAIPSSRRPVQIPSQSSRDRFAENCIFVQFLFKHYRCARSDLSCRSVQASRQSVCCIRARQRTVSAPELKGLPCGVKAPTCCPEFGRLCISLLSCALIG